MKLRRLSGLCLLIAGVLAVSGCVVVPVPHTRPSVVHGHAIAEEALRASVVPGQSRDEVVERLGAPAFNFGGGRLLVYPWTIDKGSIMAFFAGGAMLGPVTWAEAQVFIVAFDDAGQCVKTGAAEVPLYRSVSGVVRSWMLAEGLQAYLRPQPRADASAIIVYRPPRARCNAREHATEPYSPFPPAVTVDDQTIGDVRKGELVRAAVTPGTHIIAAEAVPGFRRPEYEGVLTMLGRDVPASVTVEVEPGQTVYAEAWLCMEMDADRKKARYQMHLELRDAEQARSELSGVTSAWP